MPHTPCAAFRKRHRACAAYVRIRCRYENRIAFCGGSCSLRRPEAAGALPAFAGRPRIRRRIRRRRPRARRCGPAATASCSATWRKILALSPNSLSIALPRCQLPAVWRRRTRWVQLYPDVASAVLHEPAQAQTSPEMLAIIAKSTDQQCSHTPADASWTALCRDRGQPAAARAVRSETPRVHVARATRPGAEALGLGLTPPRAGPGKMLAIDALYLTGVGYLLSDRFQEAADALGRLRSNRKPRIHTRPPVCCCC